MASKKIQVEIDVQSESVKISSEQVLTLTEQLRILRKEIQKTAPGPEQDLLIGKFNEINDELDKTNLKSKEFLGALGSLPGPVGQFAGSLDFAVNSLKSFTSFSFKDVKKQVTDLIDDFKLIAGNIGKATGITKIYTVINNALAKSFVAVGAGETAAAAGARAFAAALTATGIGAIVVALGFLISKLIDWISSTEDADAANKALNDTLKEQERLLNVDLKAIDAATRQNLLRAKVAGKTEQELFEIQKKAGEDRLAELRRADEENYKLLQKAQKDNKTSAETINEINKKSAEINQQIIDQINANEEASLNNQVRIADEKRQKQKEANDKAIAQNKQYLDKVAADNKTADDALLDLQQENAVLALKNERDRQDQELKNAKANEEAKINALLISNEKKNMLLAQVDAKFQEKQNDLNAARNKEDEKNRQEALLKLRDIEIAAIKDETERAKVERQNRFDSEKKDLDKALEDKKISQEEYNTAIKNLEIALANDKAKIQKEADDKEMDKNLKKLDDELRFLQIKAEAIRQGTKADFDNRRAILNAAEARELADTELTESQKTAIKEKYVKLRKDLDQQEVASYAATASQTLDALAKLGNAIASTYDEEAKTSKAAFDKRKRLQKATAVMSAASGIIQILSQPSVLPSPFDWITKGINAAALAIATGVQIGNINKTQFEGGGSASGGNNLGRNYESGGMINGPRHAQGGVMINAEGGEAVMTRGAVTMFAPLLSAMNQMGGGTAFNSNLNQGLPDAPVRENPALNQQPMVMKTYVVSNELTSEAEKQARLKDLSTL